MNGATGYGTDISDKYTSFNKKLIDVMTQLGNSYKNFMEWASIWWASDNAVAFQKNVDEKEKNLETSYMNTANAALNSVKGAILSATAPHSNPVSIAMTEVDLSGSVGAVEFKNNDAGMVGMNIEEMQKVLTTYSTALTEVITALSGLPESMPLYDPANQLTTSFSTGIDTIKMNVQKHIEEIEQQVSDYVNIEIHDIELGKEAAKQKLAALSSGN